MRIKTNVQNVQSIGIGTVKPNIYSKVSVLVSVSKMRYWCITRCGQWNILSLLMLSCFGSLYIQLWEKHCYCFQQSSM